MNIDKTNYRIVRPYLPDDEEAREWFDIIDEMINDKDIELPENEAARIEINEFFKLINNWIDTGFIIIPEKLENHIREIKQPLSYPTNTAVLTTEKTVADINDMLKMDNIPENGQTKANLQDVLPNIRVPLNSVQTDATTKLTYTLTENDRLQISDLELPKKKEYVYKEIRTHFGNPVDTETLQTYGINKFARLIMDFHPDGYKISEIKSIITRVLDYDKYKQKNATTRLT